MMEAMTPFADPWVHFDAWFAEAQTTERYPEAVNLATADAAGRPSSRVVLVRSWSPDGFVLFTDRESRKGTELAANPHAALCWHWPNSPGPGLGREVRAQGAVAVLDDAASDEYWRTRPRASQVAATTSHQSQQIDSRAELERRYAEVDATAGETPPRPQRWGVYRLVPDRVEFWAHHDDRLHDRLLYVRDDGRWTNAVLQP
jgi:pyridoxamine 5'-phosphate oxidase